MYKIPAGFGSIVRSLWMVFSHITRKRDTILYPEVPAEQIVPPRFRGRIILTRDPDDTTTKAWRHNSLVSLSLLLLVLQ